MMERFPIIFVTYCVTHQFIHIQAKIVSEYDIKVGNINAEKMKSFLIDIGNDVERTSDEEYCKQTYKACTDHNTYYDHISSINSKRRKGRKQQVCAHNNQTGLDNFDSPCDIAYKNCLIRRPVFMSKQNEVVTSMPPIGTYYYNGKIKPCLYYLKKTKTYEEAIKLYYADTLDFKKLDEKRQITVPPKKELNHVLI